MGRVSRGVVEPRLPATFSNQWHIFVKRIPQYPHFIFKFEHTEPSLLDDSFYTQNEEKEGNYQ